MLKNFLGKSICIILRQRGIIIGDAFFFDFACVNFSGRRVAKVKSAFQTSRLDTMEMSRFGIRSGSNPHTCSFINWALVRRSLIYWTLAGSNL